nr:alcohol dehydrogenase [Myxococcota bacterium]
AVLEQLEKLSPRVSALALTGEVEADAAAIRKLLAGGADLGLDLIGHATDSKGIQAVLGGLRWGGRLVIQGSMDVPLEVPYGDVMVRDIEIRGAFMYPRDAFRMLARMSRSGALDLSCVDVHSFTLDDIDEALETAAQVRGLGHVVVVPG